MTDNQGNAYAVLNHNTKKWPCSAILMEICAQAHAKDCHPAIQHVKRDRNTWADQLSNLDYEGFDPGRRIDTSEYEGNKLMVLPALLKLQADLEFHTHASHTADTVAR
jgi:hypothetical protein